MSIRGYVDKSIRREIVVAVTSNHFLTARVCAAEGLKLASLILLHQHQPFGEGS